MMRGLVCSHMTGSGLMDAVSEWAAMNDYVQCAGCLGYGKSSDMRWKNVEQYMVFPYCTDACYTAYMTLPLSE